MEEHKRHEVGARGPAVSEDASSRTGRPTDQTAGSLARDDETMKAERPHETSDREPKSGTDSNAWPAEATSAEGREREGVHEATTASDQTGSAMSQHTSDRNEPTTLAYAASQRPNLPKRHQANAIETNKVQGAGRMEEPVEMRANGMVFDEKTGNFIVKDEAHGAGKTSQDKT